MESGPLSPTLLVSAVLDAWPQTVPVFVHRRVGCAGCAMASFCTLEDVARYYHLSQEQLLQELESERHKMDKPYTYLPNLAGALPEITENTVVSRSLYKDEKTDVTLFGFAAGQELTEHPPLIPPSSRCCKAKHPSPWGMRRSKARPGPGF
jgi:hybrid cluster-associated redox disulfide protein